MSSATKESLAAPPIATWLPPSRSTDPVPADRATRRRVGLIWGLLFFNVLSYASQETVVRIPSSLGKLMTQGALGLAFLLALAVNRKLVVRPNTFLVISTVLALSALMMS